ncbi:MAG: cell filamentation protein Fic, partial [Verrucomicrobia bacterium]|nr:cell filamentation protein Fic [Verrucomicrobiota bacterium]
MATDKTYHLIGYAWLADAFKVDAMPHFVESFVAKPGERKTVEKADGCRKEFYPWSTIKLETVCDHLEFALKREGLHLELLRAVLPRVPVEEVQAFVRATPTGATARCLWYLWERFTNSMLDIPDLTMGNYIALADPEIYYTGPEVRHSRWRIINNLIGNIHFSPMLRRSSRLVEWEKTGLEKKCRQVLEQYPPNLYQRALSWLYSKETKSSYAIEQ